MQTPSPARFGITAAACACLLTLMTWFGFRVFGFTPVKPATDIEKAPIALIPQTRISTVPTRAVNTPQPSLTAIPNAPNIRQDPHDSAGLADGIIPKKLNEPIRCDSAGVWFLPVRDQQFKVTAGFGFHKASSPYFAQMKSHNLLAATAIEGVFHAGVDLQTGFNAPVFAVAAGRVMTVAYSDLIGKHIIVDIGAQQQEVYGHLADSFVVEGQPITCGQVLGISGASGKSIIGAHLHFEVRDYGQAINPMPFLQKAYETSGARMVCQ